MTGFKTSQKLQNFKENLLLIIRMLVEYRDLFDFQGNSIMTLTK
jgi:hypothetical protein